jgi:tetratricopeptide (TPR) repeat protein
VTVRGSFLRARRVLGVSAAAFALLSIAASAQPVPAPPLPISAPTAPPAPPPPVNSRGVIMPSGRSADIQAHWAARRGYVRERDERRADDEEQRVRTLREELGIENLFSVGAALVRESRAALDAGASAVAVQRCKLAIELAPALPAAHLCMARAVFADSPALIKTVFGELSAAARTALAEPRVSRAVLANALTVVFVGVLLAGLAFVVVLFLRHAHLYRHDVHHLFPGGANRWQTGMLAAVLLLLPLLLQMGPVPLLFTALLACGLYLSTAEAAITVLLLGALAASPWAAERIARVAAFGGPAMDVWLVEHGEGAGPEIVRLQKRLDSGNELAVDFALARKAKREGDLATAEKLSLRALEVQGASAAGLAAVRNNLGNVYLLQGETAKAIAQYQQAVDLRESLAAPHFNVSRALAMGGVETLEKVQAEQARALELDRAAVEAFSGGQLQASRKSNRFVMDVPLDPSQLEPLIEAEERAADAVGDEVRAQLASNVPGPVGAALPVAAAIAVLALHLARSRLRPSGRCERCGREVCRRCDPDARPSEALCAQCVNVFIRRSGVDPAERVRKEYAVEAYYRRRQLAARILAVVSGAGHVLLGYSVRGLLFLLVTASLLASVVLWRGVAHDPLALRSGISFLRLGFAAAFLLAVYAVCLRDLLARQRSEGGT